MFSNDSRINIEKSVSVAVPCDSYHPALDFMLTFVDDLTPIDSCHKIIIFVKPVILVLVFSLHRLTG